MNIYEEAWDELLKKHGTDKIMWNNFQSIALADLMLDFLDAARIGAKEYQEAVEKRIDKALELEQKGWEERQELDMHPDAVYGRKWLKEQGD